MEQIVSLPGIASDQPVPGMPWSSDGENPLRPSPPTNTTMCIAIQVDFCLIGIEVVVKTPKILNYFKTCCLSIITWNNYVVFYSNRGDAKCRYWYIFQIFITQSVAGIF